MSQPIDLFNFFYKIDENDEINNLKFSKNNINIFPLVRCFFYQSIIEDYYKLGTIYDNTKFSFFKKIVFYLKTFKYKPSKKKVDYLFFGTDISNIFGESNSYYNRLIDDFACKVEGRIGILESSFMLDYKRPRVLPNVFANDYFLLKVRFLKKLHIRKNTDYSELISKFIDELKKECDEFSKNNNLNIDNIIEKVRISLDEKLQVYDLLYVEYDRYFKKVSPKKIFVEEGYYGNDKAILIAAAKKNNIITVEHQHGLICLMHPAYSYSMNICSSYLKYMPDYFLTYGKYWSLNSSLPKKKHIIGNPYLTKSVERFYKNKKITKENKLLYVSSAIHPEQNVKEVILLKEMLKSLNIEIMFRVHPSEKMRLETIYKPIIEAGIKIDTDQLYITLAKVKYVYGLISTVLYESMKFNCVPFVKKTIYTSDVIDLSIFNVSDDLNSLVLMIRSGDFIQSNCNDVWADNWEYNFTEFLKLDCI